MTPTSSQLSGDELRRYHRQILLPQIGEDGQAKLKRSGVLVVGAGGLGSPAALYLAAAGVGRLGIVDRDTVETSNLQRQILHRTAGIGGEKTASARETIASLNPHVEVEVFPDGLDRTNAEAIIGRYDAVLGCVDNFVTRYELNRACLALGKPNVFGSAARFEGQASVFCLPGGPCYRCFFRDPPPDDYQPSPEEQAVLGTMPGIIGCIQANEAIKLLLGIGAPLSGRFLLLDGLAMRVREIAVRRDPECPACGRNA